MPSFKTALISAGLIVVLLGFIEALVYTWRGGKKGYDWKTHNASLMVALMRTVTDKVVPLTVILPGGLWLYEHRVLNVPMGTVWSLVLVFFLQEFSYYWFHRAGHRVRWLWANHAVHHSPNTFNLSAAYRLGVTGKAGGGMAFFLPMCWLGFDPKVVMASFTINLLYQFWIHAEWIPRLGWLEGILNTPSAHRVHHAANLAYLDANYGGVLVIFDRLFGTYVPEREDLAPRYGLVEPLRSHNPIVICFFEWRALFRDLAAARSVKAFAGHIFMPPGWSPDGQGSTTDELRRRAGLTAPKADPAQAAIRPDFTLL